MLNKLFRANIRWQTLAEPFLNYCDGVRTPLFEEFATGVEAISATPDERRQMFADPTFRREFRAEWECKRGQTCSIAIWPTCGSSRRRCQVKPASRSTSWPKPPACEPLEYFMDLLAEHDSAIRWKTVVTNDRDQQRQFLFAHDTALPGFNDSGAHARNMAFQDGGLQMLQQVQANPGVMPIEKAIHKLTGQSADVAGARRRLCCRPSRAADVIVVDPEQLAHGPGPADRAATTSGCTARCEWSSDPTASCGQVFVGGRLAFEDGQFVPEFGPGAVWPAAASVR